MKILIADDRIGFADELADIVSALLPDAFCIRTDDTADVLPLFEKYRFDTVFMDIEMHGTDCILLAQRLLDVKKKTNIIFISDSSEYAVRAFGIYASAFIIKPLSASKIAEALDNLRFPVSDITDEMIEREFSGTAVVGMRIKKWREERGMSRQEFADALGVEMRTVYRWENAERTPDIPTYMKILQVLGKNKDSII